MIMSYVLILLTTVLTTTPLHNPEGTSVSMHYKDIRIIRHYDSQDECVKFLKDHPFPHANEADEAASIMACIEDHK